MKNFLFGFIRVQKQIHMKPLNAKYFKYFFVTTVPNAAILP